MSGERRTKVTGGSQEAVKPARRGPKPALQLETVLTRAIALADEEGLDAVTMQRLAQAFGFTPMSLYRYVRNKEALLDGMIDAALGPPRAARAGRAWRDRLDDWAHDILACFTRHPWVLAATSRRRPMGANERAWMEQALEALSDAGLSPSGRHGAFLALIGHVRSVAEFSRHPPEASLASGRRKDGFRSGLRILFAGIAAAAAE